MRAVLLAAGRGERMGPLTREIPKALLSVGRLSIVSRAVSTLFTQGISFVTVVDGFAGERLRADLTQEFGSDRFEFVRNEAFDRTNNAYSLWLARGEGPFLLLDGDVVFESAVLSHLLGDPRPDRLALRTQGEVCEEDMKVRLGSGGRVLRIGKDIPMREAAGESIGIAAISARLSRLLFDTLARRLFREGRFQEWYEASFQELIEGGETISATDLGSLRCVEVDTPEDLDFARDLFAETLVERTAL